MKHISEGRKALISCLIVGGLLGGGVSVGLAQTPAGPVRMPPALAGMVDKPAPDFNLTLLSGKKVELRDFHGKVLLLNFWYSR